MFGLGMQEVMIVGVVAVILFGKKLPEVARSMGSSYRELRKGLHDFQSAFNVNDALYPRSGSSYASSSTTPARREEPDDYERPTAPKFELPSAPDADPKA